MSTRRLPVGVLQWIVTAACAACRSAGGDGGRGVGLEQVPDAAGEVALEAADGFAAGLALGLFAGEVGGGLGVQAALGDGEAMERAVELAVAAPVEAVALRSARGCRTGAEPAVRASLASLAKRVTPAISPSSLAAVRTPQPRSASSLGASTVTRSASSASRPLMVRVSSRMRRSSSRAIRTRALCSARVRRPPTRVCQLEAARARSGISVSGQRSCRCQRRSLLSAVRCATSRSR